MDLTKVGKPLPVQNQVGSRRRRDEEVRVISRKQDLIGKQVRHFGKFSRIGLSTSHVRQKLADWEKIPGHSQLQYEKHG